MTGGMLSHADQALATTVLGHLGAGTDAPFVAAEVRHLGAAASRDVPGGSAVGGRDGAFTFSLVALPQPALFDDRGAGGRRRAVPRPQAVAGARADGQLHGHAASGRAARDPVVAGGRGAPGRGPPPVRPAGGAGLTPVSRGGGRGGARPASGGRTASGRRRPRRAGPRSGVT